jgi:DNA-binding response OmpR family regulator
VNDEAFKSQGSRPRILVCEAQRDIAEVLRAMLDREGYDCDLAPTLKDARALLSRRHYAAMTLDLSLPDGSGIGLLHEIRQNPATQDLPVIVISANLDQNRRALNGNVFDLVDWLEKPIPAGRLEQVLRRSCAANAAKRPRVLHVEDDPDITNIVAGVLSRTAEVVNATTVLSAWELLKVEDFDLLILDIGLPDGSGLELLPVLRKATSTPIPSLVFSAHELSPRSARTVTASLLKSKTSTEQLVLRVRQLLNRTAGPSKTATAAKV